MGLQRQTDSNAVFLAVKHFALWQEIKQPREGSVSEQVTNPETKEVLTKHGFKYKSVEGRAIKLEQYRRDHGRKVYVGYKLHLQDGADLFVLDMPYQSTFLRKFLKIAPNVNWEKPLSITVFKGKDKDGEPETAIWFQQGGETIKHYFTRETPRGMPEATQDPVTKEWDFKPQQRWLVDRMMNDTVPSIAAAAAKFAPPVPHADAHEEPDPSEGEDQASDDDLPRPMPRSGSNADDPQLNAWLTRAALNKTNSGKVIEEICEKLWEFGEAVAHAAWTDCGSGTRSDEDTIRSLADSLKKASAK